MQTLLTKLITSVSVRNTNYKCIIYGLYSQCQISSNFFLTFFPTFRYTRENNITTGFGMSRIGYPQTQSRAFLRSQESCSSVDFIERVSSLGAFPVFDEYPTECTIARHQFYTRAPGALGTRPDKLSFARQRREVLDTVRDSIVHFLPLSPRFFIANPPCQLVEFISE